MELKKKVNKSLILPLIIGTLLVYSLIGFFVLKRGLLFPKAQASPATCTVNDDLEVSGIIRGRMDCYALKIECNGNCGALGGSVDDKCIAGVGAKYRALSVSCANPMDSSGTPNRSCYGPPDACETIPIAGSTNIGDICTDRGGWDIVVTCCAIP